LATNSVPKGRTITGRNGGGSRVQRLAVSE
jgi:hypothetical protein